MIPKVITATELGRRAQCSRRTAASWLRAAKPTRPSIRARLERAWAELKAEGGSIDDAKTSGAAAPIGPLSELLRGSDG